MGEPTAAILGLDHIQLAIPPGSEPACRAFWAALLGFAEIAKPEQLAPRCGAWFRTCGADDAGHPVRWDDAIPGRRRFFTDDPVGNRLEFVDILA